MTERISDIEQLVPSFRALLGSVLYVQQGQGYPPILFETVRSAAREASLVAAGKSRAVGGHSMHCYGLAADVICGVHQWDCARHQCRFFEALGANAEDHGLTWGGRWGLHDLPHIQAVTVAQQAEVRACPIAGLELLLARLQRTPHEPGVRAR